VTAKYKDVGQLAIDLKDDTAGNPISPTVIRGGTGNIVSKPASILLSAITRTNGTVNAPPIVDENSSIFMAAGTPFRTTVTVRDAENSATPNFGLETPAESVGLLPVLVAPTITGSNNPAVAKVGTHTYASGVATNVDFSWPEVGIITLTPHIFDGDYLGAGDATGATTANVGRFIPNDFAVTPNVPQFPTACASGNFTYLGQPLSYTTTPVLSVTARAVGGSTTRNYTDKFFKITNTSLTSKAYSAVAGTLDTTGVPATDPVIRDLTNGLAVLTFNSGTGIKFARTTPVAPITAQISLGINVIDSDGVAATANPVSFNNIAFANGAEQRYGRIAFRNAVGSELLNLPVPMRTEYFVNPATGFVTNAAEGVGCTTAVTLSLTNFGGNLATGETCVVDSGSPGASGAGCAAPGVVGQRFTMPPLGGDFIAILRAPGAGNDGTVTISTSVPTWLRFDWNTATLGDENPSGIATFGLFKGEPKRIFQTEK
jgi:MSHA biogenesis protein MshQ